MMKHKWLTSIFLACVVFTFSACGGDTSEQMEQHDEKVGMEQIQQEDDEEPIKHVHEPLDESGKLPYELKEAENPTFPVGTKVKIFADHMEGMKEAEGTVVGVYDTTAYAISFIPTSGGEKVNNYKWVIHEELEGASGAPMQPGRELVINAAHMQGMKGANATVEAAEEGPVYMVDFTTTTGVEVKNYKWLIEAELVAK